MAPPRVRSAPAENEAPGREKITRSEKTCETANGNASGGVSMCIRKMQGKVTVMGQASAVARKEGRLGAEICNRGVVGTKGVRLRPNMDQVTQNLGMSRESIARQES